MNAPDINDVRRLLLFAPTSGRSNGVRHNFNGPLDADAFNFVRNVVGLTYRQGMKNCRTTPIAVLISVARQEFLPGAAARNPRIEHTMRRNAVWTSGAMRPGGSTDQRIHPNAVEV